MVDWTPKASNGFPFCPLLNPPAGASAALLGTAPLSSSSSAAASASPAAVRSAVQASEGLKPSCCKAESSSPAEQRQQR